MFEKILMFGDAVTYIGLKTVQYLALLVALVCFVGSALESLL